MKRLILYTFFTAICIYGCRDHLKLQANNEPQGYADSQVVGTWKVTAYTSSLPYDWDGNGSLETDIFGTWSSCQQDNLYTFVGDKTGTFKVNCSNTFPGSWYIATTSFLVYSAVGYPPESEKFISMTSVQFQTTVDITTSTGNNITLTKTWTRQ